MDLVQLIQSYIDKLVKPVPVEYFVDWVNQNTQPRLSKKFILQNLPNNHFIVSGTKKHAKDLAGGIVLLYIRDNIDVLSHIDRTKYISLVDSNTDLDSNTIENNIKDILMKHLDYDKGFLDKYLYYAIRECLNERKTKGK